MLKTLIDFAATLNLPLSQKQAEQMLSYANLVWNKKDFLNLKIGRAHV